MRLAGWTTFIFAIVVFTGGMIGYATAHSPASLIAGIVFSIILMLGGIGMLLGKRLAAVLSLLATLFLDGFFSYRFMISFSFMPAGMMATLCLLTLIIQVYGLRKSVGSRHAS